MMENCQCTRTWVLVVHNSFKGIVNDERFGNEIDVNNLRRAFSTQRQCRFAELADCCSADILRTLSNKQLFVQLFHPGNDYEPLRCQPEVLLLFVLTHGEAGGVILTDQLLQGCDLAYPKFDSYTTQDMWNSLSRLDLLKRRPKVLFMAPCRGKHKEWKITKEMTVVPPTTVGSWISAKPNCENFIIFYATIESFSANRNEQCGTWLVQDICFELTQIEQEEDILTFLTKVQYNLCQRLLRENAKSGQTPQLHMFGHRQFSICAAHSNTSKSYSCIVKTENCPLIDGTLFYSWAKNSKMSFRRGKTLIFSDERHAKYSNVLATTFQQLQYETRLGGLSKIAAETTRVLLRHGFLFDGSLVLCVLAELEETPTGLCYRDGSQLIPLSSIIDQFCGQRCLPLIGKPKIFLFLDEGSRTDGMKHKSLSKFSDLQFSNAHAGCCVFVGVGRGNTKEGLILELCNELKSPEYDCLQKTLLKLISHASSEDEYLNEEETNTYCVKSQMISTLPLLVDFPHLENIYQPKFYAHPRFNIFMLGIALLLIIAVAAVLGGLLSVKRTENSNLHMPSYIKFENDSCELTISNTGLATDKNKVNQPLLMDELTWNAKTNSCFAVWGKIYAFESNVSALISSDRTLKAVAEIQSLTSAAAKPELVLSIIALIHYDRNAKNLRSMLKFASLLENEKWRFQTFYVLQEQMLRFNQRTRSESLDLAFYLSNETNEALFESMKLKANEAQDIIVNNACLEKKPIEIKFSLLSEEIRRNVLPYVIAKCSKMLNSTDAVERLIQPISELPTTACFGLYLLFQSLTNLSSIPAYTVLAFSREAIAKSNSETEKCDKVVATLDMFEATYTTEVLKMYDRGEWKILQGHILKNSIFTELVKHRYNANSENITLKHFLWGDADFFDITCIGSLELAEKMESLGELSSIEGISLLSHVKMHGDVNQAECINVINIAPDWVQDFLFELDVCCDFFKNETCSAEFVASLDVYFTGRRCCKQAKREDLFLYFIAHDLNKYLNLNEKITNYTLKEDAWEEDLARAVLQDYADGTDEFDSLDIWFSAPFLAFTLQFSAHYVYKSERSISQAVTKFERLWAVEDVCLGIFYLYKEIEKQSDLETVEAVLLYIYAETTVIFNTRLNMPEDLDKVEDCNIVLNSSLSSNYTIQIKDSSVYLSSTHNGTSRSWEIDFISVLWILLKLKRIAYEKPFNEKAVIDMVKFASTASARDKLYNCPAALNSNEHSQRPSIQNFSMTYIDTISMIKVSVTIKITIVGLERSQTIFIIKLEGGDKIVNYLELFCNSRVYLNYY